MHRDFRAANILVAAERPLHVVVADFGVSHQLRAYQVGSEGLGTAAGAGTAVRTVLTGDDALSPLAWAAPEVVAGSVHEGVTVTPAGDVYMLGGLIFEVLTCGLTPYHWLNCALMVQRRRVATGKLFRPPGTLSDVAGLGDASVLNAATMDGVEIQWRTGGGSVYDTGIGLLVDLMERCWASDASHRPRLSDVQARLQSMLSNAG